MLRPCRTTDSLHHCIIISPLNRAVAAAAIVQSSVNAQCFNVFLHTIIKSPTGSTSLPYVLCTDRYIVVGIYTFSVSGSRRFGLSLYVLFSSKYIGCPLLNRGIHRILANGWLGLIGFGFYKGRVSCIRPVHMCDPQPLSRINW